MRVIQTHITSSLQIPFAVIRKKGPGFSSCLHAHPELELVHVRSGNGRRIVGHLIAPFQEGDMVLLGSMLPHRWIYEPTGNHQPASTVLYFNTDTLAGSFYEMNECRPLQDLLQRATQGLCIKGKTRQLVASRLEKLSRLKGLPSFTGILDLLQLLATSTELESLAAGTQEASTFATVTDRLSEVYEYIAAHYHEELTLSRVAAVAHLSETAFCRLFRQRTQNHFTAYLNEIRLQHACHRLQSTDEPISLIAEACGFKTVSNFNKCFKKGRKSSPSAYRHSFQQLAQ